MNNGLSLTESFSMVALGERLLESFEVSMETFFTLPLISLTWFSGDNGLPGIPALESALAQFRIYNQETAQKIRTALAQSAAPDQAPLPDPA